MCAADSGEFDLCQACRRAAAEAARQAAAARQSSERARIDEASRNSERERELQARMTREAEQARLAQQALERRLEAERAERERLAAVRVAPIGSSPYKAVVDENAPFDPYAVLNVPPEVCKELVALAYHAAKKRYDPELADFCGDEVKAHFRAKAEALDRAYEMLVGRR